MLHQFFVRDHGWCNHREMRDTMPVDSVTHMVARRRRCRETNPAATVTPGYEPRCNNDTLRRTSLQHSAENGPFFICNFSGNSPAARSVHQRTPLATVSLSAARFITSGKQWRLTAISRDVASSNERLHHLRSIDDLPRRIWLGSLSDILCHEACK
ncbi:WD-40 repeat family protein / beige-related [Striga asiatica]|uniref:WD-40 repeat family protein / beige-related n=1 Tax=Striga asiatica TaxID=4170 RepID=A0A5A7PIB2_STRAF|nr:WD-40 repeat family protein / beige-related [Striga asiatica]